MSSSPTIEGTLGALLRRLRAEHSLSLRTLAERTGFSASFLSQVENGQASPSISSLERIAAALGVTLGQFFHAAEATTRSVIRAGDRPTHNSEWSKAQIEALGAGGIATRFDPMMVTLEPGGGSGKRPHAAPTEEFALVVEGSVVLTLGDEPQTLQTGDAATIRAGVPRRWENVGTEPARVLVVAGRAPI